jgi:hypothetical protein
MGTYAPALGLIVAIIGMMKMLANMQHASNFGPMMVRKIQNTNQLQLSTILFRVLSKLSKRVYQHRVISD